jgi:uncharacterized phage protein (TIGR01671 family)
MTNREIKFRAWVPSEKQMRRLGEWTFEFVGTEGALQMMNDDDSSVHPIPPGTVLMQFTGLKDKNGKDIYEGDIVRMSGGTITEASFDEWAAKFSLGGGTGIVPEKDEVIGNIYENPELLK